MIINFNKNTLNLNKTNILIVINKINKYLNKKLVNKSYLSLINYFNDF